MRISEAYEHDSLLPYQEESCVLNGCNKVGTQCLDVSVSMLATPTSVVGTPEVSCQGTPEITCEVNEDGTSCTLIMTQQVCVSVPVRYGLTLTNGETTIGCADSCVGRGCC